MANRRVFVLLWIPAFRNGLYASLRVAGMTVVLIHNCDAGGCFAICANDAEHKLVLARVLVNFD
jgi:hypothetical protein